MTSLNRIIPGLLGILMLSSVVAEEPQCNSVCWMSFSSRCNSLDGLECTFKGLGYTYYGSVDDGGPVLIPENHEYEVMWTGADPDYPVRIAWHFLTDQDDDVSMPPYLLIPPIQWDMNITSSQPTSNFFFSPGLRFEDNFPNDHTNMTQHEAADEAASIRLEAPEPWNYLSISQPEKNEDDMDLSDPFTIQKTGVLQFLDGQREKGRKETYDKWKLGVGIGVGVGVPILLAAAFICGWFIGRRPKTTFQENASPK